MAAKDGVNFKIVNDKIEISTAQALDADEFVRRIAGIEAQKTNFEMQIGFIENQIADQQKQLEQTKQNIKFATEDLERAYTFLKENNKGDLKVKIDAKIKENKEKAMAQQPMPQ